MTLRHTIGENSAFDADMNFMERLVRHRHDPTNVELNHSLFNHYIGVALDYWVVCKTKFATQPPEDFVPFYSPYLTEIVPNYKPEPMHNPMKVSQDFQTIRSQLSTYNATFYALLEEIQNNFTQTQTLNMLDLLRLFMFTGRLMCLDPQPITIGIDVQQLARYLSPTTMASLYLLANNTGAFGYNSYLYAYLNGVNLVGFPADDQDIEGLIPICPAAFSLHDLDHITMQEGTSAHEGPGYNYPNLHRDHLDTIYYGILNRDLSRLEKEAMIMALWTRIHEGAANDFVTINPSQFIAYVIYVRAWSVDNYMFDEFNQYISLTMTPENIDRTERLIRNADLTNLPPRVIYDFNQFSPFVLEGLASARIYLQAPDGEFTDSCIYELLMVYMYAYVVSTWFNLDI